MKRFVIKVLLVLLIALFIYLLEIVLSFCVFGDRYETSYNASIIDKMNRLKCVNSPKIILVGNSNLAFGINSPMMEQELGMPVVNLGLHGGLGNAFNEKMALEGINPGDYVVVAHSSYSDNGDIPEFNLAWLTLEHHMEFYRLIPEKSWLRMGLNFPAYVYNTSILWLKGRSHQAYGAYARSSFNAQGDNVFPREKSNYHFEKRDENVFNLSNECRDRLNQLRNIASSQRAYMLIASSPYHSGAFAQDPEKIHELEDCLKKNLKADVISDFRQYIFSPDSFFDTSQHLTDSARDQRTRLLISDIKRWRESHGIK